MNKKLDPYQVILNKDQQSPALILSMLHLDRGIFLTSGSDMKINFWKPGKSQSNNYLGQIEEENSVAANFCVFGKNTVKKQAD